MAGVVHGGGLTAAMARYGGARRDWLDLSTGINPNIPALPDIPSEVWNRLPDQGLLTAAITAARDWYSGHAPLSGEGDTLPLAVPGTQSFIQILPRLVPPDRPVAILSPTYGEYAHCLGKAGFHVDLIPTLEQLRTDHGALVVVNPNNPDGRTLSRTALRGVHARLRDQGGHLHVDEAFGDGRPELSLAGDASDRSGLTVSRSFGKFFGVAGLRLGFVFAHAGTRAVIDAALGPWAVSGPALYLATALMSQDRGLILQSILARKTALATVLQAAGLTVAGGAELFALVTHDRADSLSDHLARNHILVRTFDYAPAWLRIGLAPDRQGDEKLATALSSFGA